MARNTLNNLELGGPVPRLGRNWQRLMGKGVSPIERPFALESPPRYEGLVYEEEFDLFLREVVLLGLFAVTALCIAALLGNTWRRRRNATPTVAVTQGEPVDGTALPFHVCVLSLALSVATVMALPLTLVMVTQVRSPRGGVVRVRMYCVVTRLEPEAGCFCPFPSPPSRCRQTSTLHTV